MKDPSLVNTINLNWAKLVDTSDRAFHFIMDMFGGGGGLVVYNINKSILQ